MRPPIGREPVKFTRNGPGSQEDPLPYPVGGARTPTFSGLFRPLEIKGGFPVNKQEILRVLDHILDPDLKDRSIVEMGFVREDDIELQEEEIRVSYTVGGPLCPYSAAVGIIIHYTLHERFKKHIKVRMKEGHYQHSSKLTMRCSF
jgi:metal-sulfur cluster biosynthetic enzyme